jgi:hypothetical protein
LNGFRRVRSAAAALDPLDVSFGLGVALLYSGVVQVASFGAANVVVGAVLIVVPLVLLSWSRTRKEG